MAKTLRPLHKQHGWGTMIDGRSEGASILIVFDEPNWPHFGKPIWCDIHNIEKIEVIPDEQEEDTVVDSESQAQPQQRVRDDDEGSVDQAEETLRTPMSQMSEEETADQGSRHSALQDGE